MKEGRNNERKKERKEERKERRKEQRVEEFRHILLNECITVECR